MTRCRQSENLEVIPHPINASDSLSEGGPNPPVDPPIIRRRSRLSLIAAVLSVPSFVVLLIGPGWLFQRMMAMEMNAVGPVFVTLFVGAWVGFLASIFGGLALRRLQGPDPERRGRGWAVFATAGIRGLLMVVSGTLGSVVLGRGGVEGGDPEFLLPRWIAGFILTLLLGGAYLRARLRGVQKPRRGRGWWAFAGGLLLHLALIAALPVSLFQAWVTFHPEIVRGGGQNRRYEGPQEPGLFAQRQLRLKTADGNATTVVVRFWENGTPRELGRREVNEATTLEWMLIDGSGSTQGLSLRWSLPPTTPPETWSLVVPSGVEFAPVLDPQSLTLLPGTRTNLWIFQNFDQALPMPSTARPDWAVEVLLQSASRSH
jgi:hypothetical protein